MACRKHRIDLNILVDHDRATFMRNIARFIDQVSEVDHLNLILAGLGCVISFFIRGADAETYVKTVTAKRRKHR